MHIGVAAPLALRAAVVPRKLPRSRLRAGSAHCCRPGIEETHRYAAYRGGSLGFTKTEGTAVNVRDKVAYSTISYVQAAMMNGSGGIAVQGPQAGMVYAWRLSGGQVADTGMPIASDWVPVSGAPVPALVGEDLVTPARRVAFDAD
jgi:hypothetical protein